MISNIIFIAQVQIEYSNAHEVIPTLGTTTLLNSAISNNTRSILSIANNKISATQVIDKLHAATHIAILNEYGDSHAAITDADIIDDISVPDESAIKECTTVLIDVNPSIYNLTHVSNIANKYDELIFLEPTSMLK